jgi:hypothetical protein
VSDDVDYVIKVSRIHPPLPPWGYCLAAKAHPNGDISALSPIGEVWGVTAEEAHEKAEAKLREWKVAQEKRGAE